MAIDEQTLFGWSETLTGLPADYLREGRERVRSWRLPHVERELLGADLDAIVAAALLSESIEYLVERGVPENKLVKKLRDDHDVWPTWAEIRAAEIMLFGAPNDIELTVEAGRGTGAHADFRFTTRDAVQARSVEFKAIGLSNIEVEFCQRMMPTLEHMVPPHGLGHLHAESLNSAAPSQVPRHLRRRAFRRAVRNAQRIPSFPRGLAGATIVGHDAEQRYVHRLSHRLIEAARQLRAEDECFAAFYWSNGAPVELLAEAVDWTRVPEHILGLIVVGSGVLFPLPLIHNYWHIIPRDSGDSATARDARVVSSLLDDRMATDAMAMFERSSGVRPTILRADGEEILRRDGRRRILPFNLVMEPDPPGVARAVRENAGRPWESD